MSKYPQPDREGFYWGKLVHPAEGTDDGDEAIAAWNRRSVTSQASEGAPDGYISSDGFAVLIPDDKADKFKAAWDALSDDHIGNKALPIYLAAPVSKRVERLEAATHRHVKRGSEYVLIGYGKMQSDEWSQPTVDGFRRVSVDMADVAIYRSVDDGSLWVRPREEFEDGRFQALQGGR